MGGVGHKGKERGGTSHSLLVDSSRCGHIPPSHEMHVDWPFGVGIFGKTERFPDPSSVDTTEYRSEPKSIETLYSLKITDPARPTASLSAYIAVAIYSPLSFHVPL